MCVGVLILPPRQRRTVGGVAPPLVCLHVSHSSFFREEEASLRQYLAPPGDAGDGAGPAETEKSLPITLGALTGETAEVVVVVVVVAQTVGHPDRI